jgi:hypothetical protein
MRGASFPNLKTKRIISSAGIVPSQLSQGMASLALSLDNSSDAFIRYILLFKIQFG